MVELAQRVVSEEKLNRCVCIPIEGFIFWMRPSRLKKWAAVEEKLLVQLAEHPYLQGLATWEVSVGSPLPALRTALRKEH